MNDIIFIHMALGLLTINILFLTFWCRYNTKEIKKLKEDKEKIKRVKESIKRFKEELKNGK